MRAEDGAGAALDYAGVTAGYGSRPAVVEDVTLRLPAQGLTVVRGANGSGKSTLVELASGYLTPRSGSVTVFGVPAHEPAARARRRVVRTRPALFPAMTVRDHVALAAAMTDADPARAGARAQAYGLEPWFDADAGSLSTGNVRKLWVLMCTSGAFDVVLLDEPFSGLDADAVGLLTAELATWAEQRQVVVVTHGAVDALPVTLVVTVAAGRIGQVVEEPAGGAR